MLCANLGGPIIICLPLRPIKPVFVRNYTSPYMTLRGFAVGLPWVNRGSATPYHPPQKNTEAGACLAFVNGCRYGFGHLCMAVGMDLCIRAWL